MEVDHAVDWEANKKTI